MNIEFQTLNEFKITGIQTKLSQSQSRNQSLISNHWKHFNSQLKKFGLSQGKVWKKYGITYKMAADYFYIAAIPKPHIANIPENFIEKTIHGGEYACFQHIGAMLNLKSSIFQIYKKHIPEKKLQHHSSNILHFEQYDYRFNWNSASSIIEIYLPLKSF